MPAAVETLLETRPAVRNRRIERRDRIGSNWQLLSTASA